MNKCEHNERITNFCASECCVWKEAGGCEACIKKYHKHLGPTILVHEDEVTALLKKFTVDHAVKPKCRAVQEIIYDYLSQIKGELSTAIDASCKNIVNRIGYPFLDHNNLLSAYKRLKNKDYKKLQQVQFRTLYETAKHINENELTLQEGRIYQEQLRLTVQLMNDLEAWMLLFQKHIQAANLTCEHNLSLITKFNDVARPLIVDKQKEAVLAKTNIVSNKQSIKTPGKHGRDVSLDCKIGKEQSFSSGTHIDNLKLNGKEIEINEKKKLLINMLKQKEETLNKAKEDNINRGIEDIMNKSKQQKNKIFTDTTPFDRHDNEESKERDKKDSFEYKLSKLLWKDRVQGQPKEQPNKQLLSVESASKQSPLKKQTQESMNESKSFNNESDEESRTKGEHQGYAYAKLPVEETKSKTEKREGIGKKLIVVPAFKDVSKLSELQSPLLKRKNIIDRQEIERSMKGYSGKEGHELAGDLFRREKEVKDDHKVQDNIKNYSRESGLRRDQVAKKDDGHQRQLSIGTVTKDKGRPVEEEELKEEEEKSIALLLKSLTLRAEEAIPYLEAALKFSDSNLSAAEYLSYLYLQTNRFKECLHVCNRLIQKLQESPDSDELCLVLNNNKAAALNSMGRYSESIFVLEKCLRHCEKDTLLKNLGDAYFSASILDKAIYNYEKALRLNENYDEAHYNLAVCLYQQSNYNNSKLAIDKALQLNPKQEHYLQLQTHILQRLKGS